MRVAPTISDTRRVRIAWLLLLCGIARADTARWAQACVQRFETARASSAKIDPRIARGEVSVRGETVWFHAEGIVQVEVAHEAGRNLSRKWRLAAHALDTRERSADQGRARVWVKLRPDHARLMALWQAAADDCLAARL